MIIYVDMCYSNFKDSEKSLNFSSILYSPFEPLNNLNIKCINNIKKNISNIIIICEDTEKGIKKEYINRLFNKFDRLDVERNTTTEGTGLGLAISKPFTKEQIKDKINNILSD